MNTVDLKNGQLEYKNEKIEFELSSGQVVTMQTALKDYKERTIAQIAASFHPVIKRLLQAELERVEDLLKQIK